MSQTHIEFFLWISCFTHKLNEQKSYSYIVIYAIKCIIATKTKLLSPRIL